MINPNVLNEAARLRALGFSVISIRPESKIPSKRDGPRTRKDFQFSRRATVKG